MNKKVILPIIAFSVSLVLVMTAFYSLGKALISLVLITAGIVFTFVPLLYIGKMLRLDIEVMRKGEKQTGRCIGYERGSRASFGALIVELEDSSGMIRNIRYNALRLYLKFPHNITVYRLDNSYSCSNLGMLTIIREVLYFSFFFAVWCVCSAGTVHLIAEILL